MKKSLLSGVLCACTFGFIAPVHAQDAPNAPAQDAAKSGTDLLLEAQKLLQVAGPNGEPSAAEKLAPAENLRRQRLAVARNAPALAKLRAAIGVGITAPTPSSDGDFMVAFPIFTSAREFARQLYQESAVRAADGDAMAAAQSGLDALRLGAQMSHGPRINDLVGIAIGAIARKSLEQYAGKLDAAQSREVARQIETIGGQMQTQTQMLRAEEKFGVQSVDQLFADFADPKKRARMQADFEKDSDAFDGAMLDLMKLSPAAAKADYQAQMDKAVARAALPYAVAAQSAPIRSDIAYTNLSLDVITSPPARFNIERDVLSNRLLAAALRLRAAKLESGQYPETFAGIDPFSPTLAPLIYQRTGDSYILHSVGPDGKDEGGAEIQTLITNDETGAKTVSERLAPDSTGDVLAPVL